MRSKFLLSISRGEVGEMVLMDRILDLEVSGHSHTTATRFVAMDKDCHLPVHTSSCVNEVFALDDFSSQTSEPMITSAPVLNSLIFAANPNLIPS